MKQINFQQNNAACFNPSLPHRDAFSRFANRADLNQAAPTRVYSICLWKYDIANPTQMNLTSNFLVLCTNMKVYLYNYS